MKIIDKISRYKQYFLRGHVGWFALTFSLIQFTVIVYELVLRNLWFIQETPLNHYTIFLVIFVVIYLPTAVVVGFYDYRRGTYKAEQELSKELSPIWRDVFKEFRELKEENRHLNERIESISRELVGHSEK
ncbi:MAG: hypothetical protein ACXAEU_21935 [Candidatus Hodarchaeales archaeon]|jgi:hypothetical protein